MVDMIDKLAPRLVVADAAAAIDFYCNVFGAVEVDRMVHDGKIVHAELSFDGAPVMVKDADSYDAAPAAGSVPVILMADVADVDALGQRLVGAGATVVDGAGGGVYGATPLEMYIVTVVPLRA